jgi:hypothetical protein
MSQFISIETAVDMTTLYRQDRETILGTSYKNQNILPKCETFDRGVFDDVLAQTGCAGIRIYYGMDSNNKVHAIIVGVNGSDEDIIFPNTDNSLIAEESRRCPDDCPPASDLNT